MTENKIYVKNQVKKLMLLHHTKDIYFLCDYYKINILLGKFSIKGSFTIDSGNNFIFLNIGLSKQEKIDILIHEFSHFYLHKNFLISHKLCRT